MTRPADFPLLRFLRTRYVEVRADLPRTPTQPAQTFELGDEGISANVRHRRARQRRS